MVSFYVNSDYYPFGMPMPNRHIQDANGYRYAYQGQEKDPETGKEAFELRLWDSRIGRWLTTDPAGQYSSPYLGMGNNPISGIDPDGGWDDDYLLNDDGSLTLIAETNQADRIFNKFGSFVELEYDGQVLDFQCGNFSNYDYTYYKFSDDFVSDEVFEFLAFYSDVEWAQLKYGTISSYIITSNSPKEEAGSPHLIGKMTREKYTIREQTHSHPFYKYRIISAILGGSFVPGPSGFRETNKEQYGRADAQFAKWMAKYQPKVDLWVYDASVMSYIKYNQHGILKNYGIARD